MTLKAFAVTLANSLITRGIDKETSVSTVLRITRSLTEEDTREIAAYQSADDFTQLSDSLVRLIEDEKRAAIIEHATAENVGVTDAGYTTSSKSTPSSNTITVDTGRIRRPSAPAAAMDQTKKISPIRSAAPEAASMEETKKLNAVGGEQREPATMEQTKQINAFSSASSARSPLSNASVRAMENDAPTTSRPAVSRSKPADQRPPQRKPVNDAPTTRTSAPATDNNHSHYTEYQSTSLSSRGAKFFWTFFVLTLPLLLLAAAAYFGIFALCVISVCALIVAMFIILGGLVVLASLVAIVSLIYGIVMMVTGQMGIGIYEIGVGIVTCGVALLVSIGIYLAATRAMPYLLRQLLAFTSHTLSQLPNLWDKAREECNKL